jgi:hypothetical protein
VVKELEYYTERKTKLFIINKLITGAEISEKHFLKYWSNIFSGASENL